MGLLSTIGAASGRAFGLTRVGAAIRDAYFNLTTLLLPGDGTNGAQNNTFLDSSTNNFTITRNGNTTQGTFSPFSQTGWSNFFNGSSDFLNIGTGYPSALDLGSSNFTIEGWVYLQAATKQLMLGNLNDTNGTCTFFVMLNNTTASARYEIKLGSTAYNLGTGTIPTNQWVHVCLMRSGTSVYLFENGAQIGTTQTYSGSITSSTNQMRVGGAVAGQHPFSGYASNLRMVIGSVVYSTSGFTVPTTPLTAITNTAMLTCQSNRFFDASANAISITTSGTPSVQAFSPFAPTAAYDAATVGGSGYFDGTGDYLNNSSLSTSLSLGTSDFCIEAWGYWTSFNEGTYGSPLMSFGGTSSQLMIRANKTSASSTSVNYYFTNGGTFIPSAGFSSGVSGGTIYLNAWNHIAVTRQGSTFRLFVNGALVNTQTDSASFGTAYTSVNIGSDSNPNDGRLAGYMTGARMVTGSAVYTAAFTPPTAPLTAISGTYLLANFTNAGITDATAKNDFETAGNAQISTTQSKFGGSSMYFDGTGDYLKGVYSPNMILSGDFTIECWINFSAHGNYGGIISFANGNTGSAPTSGWALVFYQTTDRLYFEAGGGVGIAATNAATANQWNHVAVVRSGSTITHYLNGTANGTGTSSATFTPLTTDNFVIGSNRGFDSSMTGYLDDVRISRYARYTANFTPPTTAFPLQ